MLDQGTDFSHFEAKLREARFGLAAMSAVRLTVTAGISELRYR
jgi:hypothetical protein